MEPYTLSVYGLSVLLNLKRRYAATVAAAFFLIEYAHYLCDFDYASAHYLSIAIFTLLPVMLCRYAPREFAHRMRASSLALVLIYFVAWICAEAGISQSGFKYAHLAVLIYQWGALNEGGGILVDVREYCSRIFLRYHSGNF